MASWAWGPFPFEGEEDADLINAGKQTITALAGCELLFQRTQFRDDSWSTRSIDRFGRHGSERSRRYCELEDSRKNGERNGRCYGFSGFRRKYHRSHAAYQSQGESKLLSECSLPLTGVACVKRIVTDLAVLEVDADRGFVLIERAPGVTVEEIKKKTAGRLVVEGDVPEMKF